MFLTPDTVLMRLYWQDAEEGDLDLPEDMELEGGENEDENAQQDTNEEGGQFPEQPSTGEDDAPGPQPDSAQQVHPPEESLPNSSSSPSK